MTENNDNRNIESARAKLDQLFSQPEGLKDVETKARETKRRAKSIEEAIPMILDAVDLGFRNALQINSTVHAIFDCIEKPVNVTNSLLTIDSLAKGELFSEIDDVWRMVFPEEKHNDKLWHVIMEYTSACETVPLVVGFAAGLRTAGLSRCQTIMMLRGFLRNVRDDDGDIQPLSE
jgi:hypothetical protein